MPDLSALGLVAGTVALIEISCSGDAVTAASTPSPTESSTGCRWRRVHRCRIRFHLEHLGRGHQMADDWGPMTGERLTKIVHGDHFWSAWGAFKPDTLIYEGGA